MDGLLIVDKPPGPTSHDVVARVRRALRERRIGHTGTLDPMASGVLPLVVGRATRLARFLPGDKVYETVVRLGVETDTHDAQGTAIGEPHQGPWPSLAEIERALAPFRGTFLQQPPVFSAKKIDGHRSYALARRAAAGEPSLAPEGPTRPAPVQVTAHRVDVLDADGDRVRLRVRCSAGFYIRSLAHDLGAALGMGAHLIELRRIEAAGIGLAGAVPLDALEAPEGRERAERALLAMPAMLASLPRVTLTPAGLEHVRVGREIGSADVVDDIDAALGALVGGASAVRLLDDEGRLAAMAEAGQSPGLLHPVVVLM